MRLFLLPLLLLTAACRQQEAPAANEQASAETAVVTYAGSARDRLCLRQEQGGTAGFVTYAGTGDTNCMVRGTFDRQGGAIVPSGDTACRIPVSLEGNSVRLGEAGPACAYYCGPNASFNGTSFTAMAPGSPANDLAGDPLC